MSKAENDPGWQRAYARLQDASFRLLNQAIDCDCDLGIIGAAIGSGALSPMSYPEQRMLAAADRFERLAASIRAQVENVRKLELGIAA